LRAEASDDQSGIVAVGLDGLMTIECIPAIGNNIVRIGEPISVSRDTGGMSVPLRSSVFHGVTVADEISRCPSSTRFYQLSVSVVARARNGAGLDTTLHEARIRVFGPDQLRVGTFNLYNPGNFPDSQFVTWGTEIGKVADVVLLTEVRERRVAELIGTAAGRPYVVSYDDLAIVSRAPLRNVKQRRVDPGPGRLGSRFSHILSAESDLGGFPHQLVVTHWGIRDANDQLVPPETSSSGRTQAANEVLALLTSDDIPVIVGGDLNAYSGQGPQRVPGVGTSEVQVLAGRLTDAFAAVGAADDAHCSDQRIDYLFSRGPIAPMSYTACFPFATPSDHPFVAVTYVPR
jgi:endonuclease/exonuclease/phosphatase (EEP) superfamily protein YafD